MGAPLGTQKVLFHCDNQSVCGIWQKGSTKQPEVMALVCMLHFCAARSNIHMLVTHIAGTNNTIADALSRSQMEHFRQLALNAVHLPNPIPAWLTQFWTDCSFITSH